ncbi:MAG: hypothetical protein R3C46_03620 [Hyphomonadaceae bacterium]
MIEVLSFFHLAGLMLGATGSLGGFTVLLAAPPAQKQKGGPIRGVGPVFARIAIIGLILLWPSGFPLALMRPGGVDLSTMFWMKLGFAVLLTFAAISTEMVYERARRGAPKVARLLLTLGPLSALCWLLVAIFSVLAFG